MWAEALLVLRKDLRIELRSKVGMGQIAPFALTILLLFGFALDPDRGVLRTVAPGLFWVAVLLSSMLAVQRSFAIESSDDARDGLRLSGLDPAAVFLGKAAAVALQLLALQVVLALGIYVLYDVAFHGMVLLLATCAFATIGIASAGTVYGVLSIGARARETLLPLLFLPVVAPVMLAATQASEAALGDVVGEGWPWLRLLGVFAAIYAAIGTVAFGPLLEDA
jgi:heme exporter protein B